MNAELARNICRYRKEKGFTQEDLAKKLGITFQAVSKWETAQALPDSSLLPRLSQELGISIDKLFGYASHDKAVTIYEEEYKLPDYYWGLEPAKICLKVLELLPPSRPLKLLDIGCGEGKDSVFFARNGYDVTAFDISNAGIEKTQRLAEKAGVHLKVFKSDLLDYRLSGKFDILYSSGVLHYIKPSLRQEIFSNYKQFTNPGGLHVFNVFVKKPFIAPAPKKEPASCQWISGELFTYYHDWLIQECSEVIFDCNSSGIPHKHAMNKIIAQKL
ncbi:methyltransferase domain-containing protein [Desulfosporosinus sp. PR]|uniref:methyltransferase domain-containing protein n=1 Tax=Candidatus Desulfosporosinus nitrosoreducens TaxID=3401928 RepID=UPI0027E738E6|nr:methyltransferase domain-containing protein [Desulfosporosinus sp. PR]MDQ7092329.1 methyltransferase domain-containing protein [Desulfosporosinus sp. PR]